MFQNKLKSCISKIGLDPADFSSHSFRRDGASLAFRADIEADKIQLMGRALTRILKTEVQDSHLTKSRSPTGKSGSPTLKKLESHQFVHTVYLFHFSRK